MTQLSTSQIFYQTWQAGRKGGAAIAARQSERLTEITAYARQHSRFYAERYRDLPEVISDVRALPVVSKSELMNRFDDWVTDPAVTLEDVRRFTANLDNVGRFYRGQYTVCTTSGTTGVPAILLHDQAAMNLMGALNLFRAVPSWMTAKEMFKIMGAGMRTAAIWATGGHYLGITMMKRQIYEKPSRARAMRIFPVLDPLPKIVAELNDFQPAMLNGYASVIALLAQEQEAGRLHIEPTLVMTSSESLAPQDRAQINKVFGGKVRDNYGCSEFVSTAYGCKEGWLHVHSDWVILEPVDADMQPVAPGQMSNSVLLTNLCNHVQPILRYNLGDRITVRPDPCPCGSPLPAMRVEGRTDEVLRLRAEDGQFVAVLPLALWSIIKETAGVHRFQVIQTGDAHLVVRVEVNPSAEVAVVWSAIQARTAAYLARQGLANVTLALADEAPSRDAKSGKYRHVWSEVKTS